MSTKVAAVLLLATPVAAMFLLLGPGGTTAALAVVQQALDKVTSATYAVTVTVDDKPGEKVKVMLLGSKLCRAVQHDGTITILDLAQRTMVRVLPAERKAVVMEGFTLPDGFNILGLLADLNRHPTRQQRVVPDRKFDGREAEGFVVELDTFHYNVWSDKTTHLPLRLESERKLIVRDQAGAEREQAIKEVWSDFVFNAKLDEALFSLIPPKDYKVAVQKGSNGPSAVLDEQKKAIAEFEKAKKAISEIEKARKQAGKTKE
jgi:outer membrane lipoprotein-sorting protein